MQSMGCWKRLVRRENRSPLHILTPNINNIGIPGGLQISVRYVVVEAFLSIGPRQDFYKYADLTQDIVDIMVDPKNSWFEPLSLPPTYAQMVQARLNEVDSEAEAFA